MRIVNVCRVVHTQRAGGMPFVAQDRAEELARQGHDVHILTTGGGKSLELNGVYIHHLSCAPREYSNDFAVQCGVLCTALSPDVIHLDSFDRDRVWWKDRPGNPKVVAVTMHGNSVGTALTKWNLFREGVRHDVRSIEFRDMDLERIGLKNADRVIAISLNEEWQLRDVLALPQTRLVYNPIPAYFFNTPVLTPAPDAPFLCAAISGHGERGFLVAQETAERLGRKLKIVKDVPRREMPGVYNECAAVMLPTRYAQGFDLTCAEAAAMGRMVYASPTGSYLREAGNGSLFVAESNTVDSFVQLIEQSPPRVTECNTFGVHHPSIHVHKWLEALGL